MKNDSICREGNGYILTVIFLLLLIVGLSLVQGNGDITFTEHTLDEEFDRASGIFIADLDGDGDNDILGAAINSNEVAWWRNDGGYPPEWSKFTIDSNFGGAMYVYVADVDGDGAGDVLATAALANELAWWRNGGGDPVIWTKEVVSSTLTEAHGVYACDLDQDGDMDILGTSADLNKVFWWEQDTSDPGERVWVEHLITDNFQYTQTLCPVDVDGDSDLDIVAGALEGNEVALFINEGGTPFVWTKQTIDGEFRFAHCVDVTDVNGDGNPDVLGASYLDHEIACWINDGGNPVGWTKQIVGSGFRGALMVHAADLDADGDPDVIGTANSGNDIAWWRNDGGDPIVWTKFVIDETYPGAWPIHTGDLDGDGDLDIASGADAADQITWWESSLKTLNLGVDLRMSQTHFIPGDTFTLDAVLGNPNADMEDIPLAVVLDVYGEFWFWPSWSKFDPETGDGFDFQTIELSNGINTIIIFEPFTWPDTGPSAVSGIVFYGAMLTPDFSGILGILDTETWSFGGTR